MNRTTPQPYSPPHSRHCSCEADAQPAADHAHQPKRIGCIGLAVMTLVYLLATAGLVDLIRLAWGVR